MVTTKHCCFGVCRSDSRYSARDYMQGVFFIPFPKPWKDRDKCLLWVRACKRERFTEKNVTKDTYICSLHFVGGKGPTPLNPDPIPATSTSVQVEKLALKRKAPTSRNGDLAELLKKRKTHSKTLSSYTISSHGTGNETTHLQSNIHTTPAMEATTALDLSLVSGPSQVTSDQRDIKKTVDNSCQTDTPDEVMKLKLENKILHKEHQNVSTPQKHKFSLEDFKHDDEELTFYTGLTWPQFMTLWNFLGPSPGKLSRHKSSFNSEKSPRKTTRSKRKTDLINELFLTLIKLRTGLLHSDLAYRFGISVSLVSEIINTWIQFMYLQFSTLKKSMFATREAVGRNLPSCFRKFKGIRTIINCTEFCVQQASNFERQGNLFSSYKSYGTYKVLFGVSPTGTVMFVSDAYEEPISDVEIVKQSGFLDHLRPGDLILANRDFTIREVLAEKGVDLNILPFLKERNKLTPREEMYTKETARVSVHVERCIERFTKFRLLGERIPLSMQPTFSQMLFVVGCLVNFQEPLVV